jgi:hypothetical protein
MSRFQQPLLEGMFIILLGIMGIFRILEGLQNVVYWNKIMLYMLLIIFIGIIRVGIKIFMDGLISRDIEK